jgi:predicted phage terminase large subunit-like protein
MILLGGKRERMEFPDLCAYLRDLNRRRKPDTFLIEKKASGQSIIQELRRQGLPMTAWTPDRDKISRVWATQPIFEAGRIWMNKSLRFSGLVMDDLESFPNGEHDDIVDSVTQAVLWMRRSRIDIFEQAEDRAPKRRVITSYWKLPKKMVY